MNIAPRHRQVLLRMDVEPDTTAGGIAMARSEADRTSQTRGTVVAIGPEANMHMGLNPDVVTDEMVRPNMLEAGQRVILNGPGYSADFFKMNGSPHILVDEKEILGIVTNENW